MGVVPLNILNFKHGDWSFAFQYVYDAFQNKTSHNA